MSDPLTEILGGRVVSALMLQLYHYNEGYAAGIAADTGFALSAVQRQLQRLENAGILISRTAGKTRLYSINPKSAYATPVKNLIKVAYDTLSLKEREQRFPTRRRPRRPGKPVLKSE